MTAQELWVEVTDGALVADWVALAKVEDVTIEEAVKAAVTGWAKVFEMPQGETVESIMATLVEWIGQRFPFTKGVHILSRFGLEWELLGYVDDKGYVKARRLEDGAERTLHTSDIKCVASTSAKA